MKTEGQAAGQTDKLLWMAAGSIAIVAFVTLAMIPFWPATNATPNPAVTPVMDVPAAAPEAAPTLERVVDTRSDSVFSRETELLNRASLALEADMLLAPGAVSAWSLFNDVLELAPDNAAAIAGLNTVADRLVESTMARGEGSSVESPLELAATILEALPEHAGALALKAAHEPAMAADANASPAADRLRESPAIEAEAPVITLAEHPQLAVTAGLSDSVPDIFDAFRAALQAGDLIAPSDESAREHVKVMRVLNPMHTLTSRAERELFAAFMERFDGSFGGLDAPAAATWLHEAELLAVDTPAVTTAREHLLLLEDTIGTTSALAETDLEFIEFIPPEYPRIELERGIEGWVDVEFTVTGEGHTRDVIATATSHETTFTNEAVFAVTQWRFAPTIIRNVPIERRVFTRLRFQIE